ncbi:hypothetical protein [Mucilaginibacter sp. CSA2-8R]|uniref:hypothetical protein n=1 Tax=Mucilaginibacter sp. CSA2-8R TaxID=3141542 RepID=UPI00315D067C
MLLFSGALAIYVMEFFGAAMAIVGFIIMVLIAKALYNLSNFKKRQAAQLELQDFMAIKLGVSELEVNAILRRVKV